MTAREWFAKWNGLAQIPGLTLTRLTGPDGWNALLLRVRRETSKTATTRAPSAASRETEADDDLRPLVAVAEILGRLVGPTLAMQILDQACRDPDETPEGGHHG